MNAMDSDPHGIRAFEHASWQRVAGDYGDTFAAATRGFIEPLLDVAGVGAHMRVLDVCCGPGLVAISPADTPARSVPSRNAPGATARSLSTCLALALDHTRTVRLT